MTNIKYIDDTLIGKKYKPEQSFAFSLAIPCVDVDEFALLVEHGGLQEANVTSMRKLADEGKAPYCLCVGVDFGYLMTPDGNARNMRMNSYDLFDREFGDFIVYELIPYIVEKYAIRISASPDMHYISGGSSGGISAFTIAWFHPEYFHRIYMSSPSFLAMGRGNEISYLVRKYETKPFRVYEEWSEREPSDYFGGSRGVAEVAKEALLFANYDFNYAYFPDTGHCGKYPDETEAYKRNEWMWQDWDTKPIQAPGNSKRVNAVIPFGSSWETCAAFPEVRKPAVPEILQNTYGKVVLSNDKQLWYAADNEKDIILSYVNNGNYDLDRCNLHAIMHTIPRVSAKGVLAMAVDQTDRIFALTEIGVQCVRSFGLIDVILDLPDSSKPLNIAITDALYVQTEAGIYRRELCEDCTTVTEIKRKQISYYD